MREWERKGTRKEGERKEGSRKGLCQKEREGEVEEEAS